MNARELTIDCGGLRWSGLEWGGARGTPVVALHGWLDNAASFSGLGPLLADKGFRVIALDLPGHGKTVPSGQALGGAGGGAFRAPMHCVDYMAPLHVLLSEVSPDQPVLLLGHSMGAGIALMYAGTFPERVSRLTLVEGLGPISGSENEGPERLRKHAEALIALRSKRAPSYPDLEPIVSRRAEAGGLGLESARVLIERAMERTAEGWIWRTDPLLRLPSPYRMTEAQVFPFLERIGCPILLFMAEKGFPHDLIQARERLARLKDVRLERVPGGHHVHLDDPRAVAPALSAFLAG